MPNNFERGYCSIHLVTVRECSVFSEAKRTCMIKVDFSITSKSRPQFSHFLLTFNNYKGISVKISNMIACFCCKLPILYFIFANLAIKTDLFRREGRRNGWCLSWECPVPGWPRQGPFWPELSATMFSWPNNLSR